MGTVKKWAKICVQSEEEELWKKGPIGIHSPNCLFNGVFVVVTVVCFCTCVEVSSTERVDSKQVPDPVIKTAPTEKSVCASHGAVCLNYLRLQGKDWFYSKLKVKVSKEDAAATLDTNRTLHVYAVTEAYSHVSCSWFTM